MPSIKEETGSLMPDSLPNGNYVDIAVIGGGPAGTAAALTLLKHTPFTVALIERSTFKDFRIGESLSPGITSLLDYLDLRETVLESNKQAIVPSYGTAAAWGSNDINNQEYFFTGKGSGWHVNRAAFDESLTTAVRDRGGIIYCGWEMSGAERSTVDTRWNLQLRCANHESDSSHTGSLKARFIIDATGRTAAPNRLGLINSSGRANAGSRQKRIDSLIGVAAVFSFRDNKLRQSAGDLTATTIVESEEDGWWYATPIPDQKLVVAYLSDSDLLRENAMFSADQWLERLTRTNYIREFLVGANRDFQVRCFPAYSQVCSLPGGQDWLAVGDALASFDPLASMGIGYALLSGIEGARATTAILSGEESGAVLDAFSNSIRSHFEEYLILRQRYYKTEQRWSDREFWNRRHYNLATTNPLPKL